MWCLAQLRQFKEEEIPHKFATSHDTQNKVNIYSTHIKSFKSLWISVESVKVLIVDILLVLVIILVLVSC